VSDIPAVHLALSAFVPAGPSAVANPIPAPSFIDEQLLAIHHIVDTRAAQIDPSSIEGPSGLPADFGPCTFAAGTTNNPNILSQSAMLRASDHDHFVVAQQPEITGLENAGVFEYLHMDELKALPFGTRLLNAIWSYRRKRRPDGTLYKYKSRICVDRSQQQYGIDYWNTYAPVVQWSTI